MFVLLLFANVLLTAFGRNIFAPDQGVWGSYRPESRYNYPRNNYKDQNSRIYYSNGLNYGAYHNVYKQADDLLSSSNPELNPGYMAPMVDDYSASSDDSLSKFHGDQADQQRSRDFHDSPKATYASRVNSKPIYLSPSDISYGNSNPHNRYDPYNYDFSQNLIDQPNQELYPISVGNSDEEKFQLSELSKSKTNPKNYLVTAGSYERKSMMASRPTLKSFSSQVEFNAEQSTKSLNLPEMDELNNSMIDPRNFEILSNKTDNIEVSDFQSSGDFTNIKESYDTDGAFGSMEPLDYNLEDDSRRDLDEESRRNKFLKTLDEKFRSLIFNPMAQSDDKYQSCVTPLNESGNCRYVQHCLLPSIVGSIDKFMNYVCIIEDRYIGICCPELPVSVVNVTWDEVAVVPGNSNYVKTPKECGVSSKTRIVGGSKSDPKAWPWMAALLTMSKGQFFCGGALINNYYVLTAAHCTFRVPRNQILVRLGEYDFGVHDDDSPGEDFPVAQIKRHAQYSRRTLHNDIALLRLARPAVLKKNVGTICLPEDLSYVGEIGTLAGWGNVKGNGPTSPVLLEASLPVLHNHNCSRHHGTQITDNLICTRSENEKGACNGDSGGPLMHLDEKAKQWKIIGIVSWGRRGCDPKFPTVYTRVSGYMDWIHAHAV